MVELLTVLGVITLFLGLLSRATMTGVGQGLVAAQNSCAGLTQVARVQASLSQVNVRLLIFADTTTPDNKLDALRMLKVVMPDPNNSNNWVSTGAKTVYLPRNIFIVAPAQPIVPVINGLPAWPVKRNSRFSQNNGLAVALQVDGVKANYFFIEFTPLNNVNTTTGEVIALAEGRATTDPSDPETVRYLNPENMRGILISQYGTQTMLNNAKDFEY